MASVAIVAQGHLSINPLFEILARLWHCLDTVDDGQGNDMQNSFTQSTQSSGAHTGKSLQVMQGAYLWVSSAKGITWHIHDICVLFRVY
jgi:hypothetical protein